MPLDGDNPGSVAVHPKITQHATTLPSTSVMHHALSLQPYAPKMTRNHCCDTELLASLRHTYAEPTPIARQSRGAKAMMRVATRGRFDLLHYGRINQLQLAKVLGDYLEVALITGEFSYNSK